MDNIYIYIKKKVYLHGLTLYSDQVYIIISIQSKRQKQLNYKYVFLSIIMSIGGETSS